MDTLPPEPHDPEPLSSREKRILAQIEGELAAAAPELDTLSSTVGRSRRTPPWRTDHVLQAAAVVVIAIALLPGRWLLTLLVFAVLAGPPIAAILTARRRPDGHVPDSPTDPPTQT
ncbi:MAG: DUF3040 domain-containing protein [Pseudonocardia sp.]|nr:DUF3040 domain-containing protein [Pseudonocardia sp.]